MEKDRGKRGKKKQNNIYFVVEKKVFECRHSNKCFRKWWRKKAGNNTWPTQNSRVRIEEVQRYSSAMSTYIMDLRDHCDDLSESEFDTLKLD